MSKTRYKTFQQQNLFLVGDIFVPKRNFLFFKNIIEDRKSRYSVTYKYFDNEKLIKDFIKNLKKEKFYNKATHNTYAYRILKNDSILEGKNDDGEIGAGKCILDIMRKENIVNSLIIVTRYYGGIHLNSDRFKHVINSTKFIIDKLKLYGKNNE